MLFWVSKNLEQVPSRRTYRHIEEKENRCEKNAHGDKDVRPLVNLRNSLNKSVRHNTL